MSKRKLPALPTDAALVSLKDVRDRLDDEIGCLGDEIDRLSGILDRLYDDGIKVDLAPIIDRVIDTLRLDPRMPKLSRFEWEHLLGDHYRIETIDIADDLDCGGEPEEAA